MGTTKNQETKITQQHDHLLYVRIRLPKQSDIPFLHKLLHKMAAFHNATGCQVTESSVSSMIFNLETPSVNVFLLEISPTPLSLHHHPSTDDLFHSIDKTFHLPRPIEDPEMSVFCTDEGTLIAGFVLFYPIYCTYLAKPGFRIQDLFVREGYRSTGFGELMMKVVANHAVKLGYAKVEWTVVNWNVGASKFYERMGARVLQNWRVFELTADALLSCGQLN